MVQYSNLIESHLFQLSTPPPTPEPTPVVGLTMGTPVIGQFGEAVQPVSFGNSTHDMQKQCFSFFGILLVDIQRHVCDFVLI